MRSETVVYVTSNEEGSLIEEVMRLEDEILDPEIFKVGQPFFFTSINNGSLVDNVITITKVEIQHQVAYKQKYMLKIFLEGDAP